MIGESRNRLELELIDGTHVEYVPPSTVPINDVPLGLWTRTRYEGFLFEGNPTVSTVSVIDEDSNVDSLSGIRKIPEAIKRIFGSSESRVATSTVWVGKFNFNSGRYQFNFSTDDGMVVFIDGQKVMDEWRDQPELSSYFLYTLSEGPHTIEVRHYNSSGRSLARLNWRLVTPIKLPPDSAILDPISGDLIQISPVESIPESYRRVEAAPIVFTVFKLPESSYVESNIELTIDPAIPHIADEIVNRPIEAKVKPIQIELRNAISQAISQLISGKIDSFFDDDRELKTLANFGNDQQELVTNWIYDPSDSSGHSLLLKLYRPLDSTFSERNELWISREISPPIIDRFYVKQTPESDRLTYLRPPNRNIDVVGISGEGINNVTLNNLIPTASAASSSIQTIDDVLKQYYTSDLAGAELNIDYSDYRNFVHFSSAAARLQVFKTKLTLIENLNNKIETWKTALSSLDNNTVTASLTYGHMQKVGDQRNELLRSFDGYERFLYHETETPYSSSITFFDEDTLYYHADATWPKASGSVVSVTSSVASTWYTTQNEIASAFDAQNPNKLSNNLPSYLVADRESQEFITFTDMIGHHFDIIKPYIDSMTKLYDRGSSADEGMSNDILWSVAQSLGLELPNKYAIKKLTEYSIGVSDKIYKDAAAETWKRILHNQVFLNKTKGTKTSIKGLMNSYGLLPSLVKIKEFGTPSSFQATSSFETFEETTNSLKIENSAYVVIPWSSSVATMQAIEFRFATTTEETSILFNAGEQWAVKLVSTGNQEGYIDIVNQNTAWATVSSDMLDLFDGEYQSVLINYNDGGIELSVRRTDAGVVTWTDDDVEDVATITGMWQSSSNLYLGGSGSYFGTPFTGFIDEFRIWSEPLTDDAFDRHVFYPGMYSGNANSSAAEDLHVRLSFNVPQNLFATASLSNESPVSNPALDTFTAVNFPNDTTFPYNMASVTREALVYSPNAGGVLANDNKVIVADAPVIKNNDFGVPQLYRNKSIVTVSEKKAKATVNNDVGIYFSLTDAINDSIIRSMGALDLQNLIGDPANQYSGSYGELETLNKFYWDNYAYGYNVNTFIRFTEDLLAPFFKQVREYVPARSKLITGMVIEPHLLERAKITFKPLDVTSPYANVEDSLVKESIVADRASPDTSAVVGDIASLIVFEDTRDVAVSYANHLATLDMEADVPLLYELLDKEAHISRSIGETLDASYLVYENTIEVVDVTDILSAQHLTLDPAVYDIKSFYGYLVNLTGPVLLTNNGQSMVPRGDFEDIGTTTFFYNPFGIVDTVEFTNQREHQSLLRDRGTWASGTFYTRDDYVVQPETDNADADPGNTKEFRCIAGASFMSYLPPYLDRDNWRAVKYTRVPVLVKKKATEIEGKISLVPFSSSATPFVGYAKNHYRYSRDVSTAFETIRYRGCKNTDDTTIDGLPVIVTTLTSADRLFVVDNSEPLQRDTDQSGPILDVR